MTDADDDLDSILDSKLFDFVPIFTRLIRDCQVHWTNTVN